MKVEDIAWVQIQAKLIDCFSGFLNLALLKKSRMEVFFKVDALQIFVKSTGKHLRLFYTRDTG